MEKIIYFVKYPRIGKVKTRLAATIGNNKAFAVYNLLLKLNWTILKRTKTFLQVEFTPAHMLKNIKVLFPEADGFSEQSGKTIGDRMANAFKKTFKNQEDSVVLLGSDLADLQQSDITTAFRKLKSHDIVVGPSLDGGYYLIGFNAKTFDPHYLKGIDWDADAVAQQTINIIRDSGRSLYILPQRIDIDTIDDINMFLQENDKQVEFVVNLQKLIAEV